MNLQLIKQLAGIESDKRLNEDDYSDDYTVSLTDPSNAVKYFEALVKQHMAFEVNNYNKGNNGKQAFKFILSEHDTEKARQILTASVDESKE